MSTIQPGDGYTFKDSSSGFNISIDKPWTPPTADGLAFAISLPKFPAPPLPPEPPEPPVNPDFPSFVDPFISKPRPLQFECSVMALPVSGTPTSVIQIAMGSVTYTQSTMPFVKTGPFTDHRQAYMNFAAVVSTGSVTPVVMTDPTSPWMLGGGGYKLTGTGRWYVTLSKWDVSTLTALGPLLNLEMPWVSIVKEGSDEFDALFVDAGPSLYQNTMNIQKMEGYQDVETSGETNLDWGHCHTTYFNPRFLGNHVRILAVIDSIPSPSCEVSIVQLRAGNSTANEIQQIIFLGMYKSGTATFIYDGVATTTSFNPGTQSAYDLQLCLNTIPSLNGNVIVQQAGPGVFQVEFTNTLRNKDVPTLTPSSSLTSFTNWYNISQMHVGSQDIVIPCELNATFLMNKAGLTEAQDPYYANANSIPPWQNISNIEAARTASLLAFTPAFATPVINDVVPRAFDTSTLVYSEEAGCTGDDPSTGHPFKVIHVETEDGESRYRIVSGTVNNLVPGNITDEYIFPTGVYQVWIKVPFLAPNFPATSGFEWDMGATLPADTDAAGYVRVAEVNGSTVTQFITGSLWGDRIKLGTQTATYYYARV
jgi:hypothetical protein